MILPHMSHSQRAVNSLACLTTLNLFMGPGEIVALTLLSLGTYYFQRLNISSNIRQAIFHSNDNYSPNYVIYGLYCIELMIKLTQLEFVLVFNIE